MAHYWVLYMAYNLESNKGAMINDKSEDRLLRLQTRSAEATTPESRVHGAGQAVLPGWRVQVLQRVTECSTIHQI